MSSNHSKSYSKKPYYRKKSSRNRLDSKDEYPMESINSDYHEVPGPRNSNGRTGTTPNLPAAGGTVDYEESSKPRVDEMARLSDIVKSICEDTIEHDEVPGKFIQCITTYLLSLTDILSEEKEKIYKIISVLVNLGEHHSRMRGVEPDISSDQSHPFRNEYAPSPLKRLYDIDNNIKNLLDQKFEIYNSLYLNGTDHYDNHLNQGSCENEYTNNTPVVEISNAMFSPTVVERAIEEVKKQIKEEVVTEQSIDATNEEQGMEHYFYNDPQNNSLMENSSVDQQHILPLIKAETQSSEDDSEEYGTLVSFKTNIIIPEYEVTCFAVLDRLCIIGCSEGTLCVHSLENGKLHYLIKKHFGSVTSVNIWNYRVITTSLDGMIFSHNQIFSSCRELFIQQPISCAVNHDGIIYLGTTLGSVFRINTQSLTHYKNQIQVSSTPILGIQIYKDKNGPKIVVAAEGKPITIRDSCHGNLLCTLKQSSNCEVVSMVDNGSLIYCGSKNRRTFISSVTNGEESMLHSLNVGANCIKLFYNHIFVGGNDGKIHIFNSKGSICGVLVGPGTTVTNFILHKKQILICFDCHHIISLTLPPGLEQIIHQS